MSTMDEQQKYRNKKTGTVYASVEFNGTPVATVTTEAGSTYTTKAENLELVTTPPQHSDEWLDEPVVIHFKEDSIPGLRRGELTQESKQAILAELKKREAAAELQGRMNECHYVRQYLHFDYYQPSHITYFSKRLYDLEDLAQLHKEQPEESK